MQATLNALRRQVLAAAADARPLRLRGGGSKDFLGRPTTGEVLDTRLYAGVVAYEPSELYITARCGTPLREIEDILAAQGQMLAFEPPHFDAVQPGWPGRSTLGGAVASGLSGPRRAQAGALRDYVLGVRMLDGRGQMLGFGGQVMKNVAGFDVSRLMAGSFGTLGVLLDITLKVLPCPPAQATLVFEMPQALALRRLNEWAGQPLPVSASCWQGGRLWLRMSGAGAAVAAALGRLGGERLTPDAAQDFWNGLREHRLAFFAGEQRLWRLSLPSTAPVLDFHGDMLIEWGGAQRWVREPGEVGRMREQVQTAGGHVTLFRGAQPGDAVFDPLPEAIARVHTRLKQAFDPAGIFNRGRLYPDL